jgi:hypothetical protein
MELADALRPSTDPRRHRPAGAPSRDELVRRLASARRRLAADVPFSPDWDAAMTEIEELEQLLAAFDRRQPDPDADPVSGGASAA